VVYVGGHGLCSTVGDYMGFIRCWLSNDAGENGRVLKTENVHMTVKNGLGGKKDQNVARRNFLAIARRRFFPGLSKSWALTFMVNDSEAPTGRPAGAIGWAGLVNLF
jgi:methyl acetate hydrolase